MIETNAASVLADFLHHIEGEGKRAAAIFKRNNRIRSAPHRVEERFQFRHERFFRNDRRAGHTDLWIRRGIRWPGIPFGHGEDQHILAAVVERDILAWLKETQLADTLGGNPARSKVGNAA